MNMSFYTASVGARQQQTSLDITSNNITNVNTYGFKSKKPSFSALMFGNISGIDNTQLPRGSGTNVILADTDFSDGPLLITGRVQDYAISGDGFFALTDPTNGEISFTRDGSFVISQFQQPTENNQTKEVYLLSDGEGRFVLSGEGTPIEVTDPNAAQPVGVFDFVNANGMQNSGGNRFTPVLKNGQARLGTGTVRQGALEASNTDLANELTKVIESQRSYSYALKMVQTSDEIETTINNLRG